MNRVKEFIKKFWWLVFIPLLSFLTGTVFKKPQDNTKKEIKKAESEIKKTEKEIEKKEKEVDEAKKEEETAKKDVKEKVKKTKEVIKDNLDKKEQRDKEAEKFFPVL